MSADEGELTEMVILLNNLTRPDIFLLCEWSELVFVEACIYTRIGKVFFCYKRKTKMNVHDEFFCVW